jgi:hypothetical protein
MWQHQGVLWLLSLHSVVSSSAAAAAWPLALTGVLWRSVQRRLYHHLTVLDLQWLMWRHAHGACEIAAAPRPVRMLMNQAGTHTCSCIGCAVTRIIQHTVPFDYRCGHISCVDVAAVVVSNARELPAKPALLHGIRSNGSTAVCCVVVAVRVSCSLYTALLMEFASAWCALIASAHLCRVLEVVCRITKQ